MIDHEERIRNAIKDEIAQVCRKLGIDKSEVGYWLNGFGSIQMLPDKEGNMGMGPAWGIGLTLRNYNLGQEPVGGTLPVPGVLPPEALFRAVVREMLPQVQAERDRKFREGQ